MTFAKLVTRGLIVDVADLFDVHDYSQSKQRSLRVYKKRLRANVKDFLNFFHRNIPETNKNSIPAVSQVKENNNADNVIKRIFKIPTNEGFSSQLLQLENLCEYLKKLYPENASASATSQFQLLVTLADYPSHHYKDIPLMRLCNYFSDMYCSNVKFECSNISAYEIVQGNAPCDAWKEIKNNPTLFSESLWGNLNTSSSLRYFDPYSRVLTKSKCMIGSIYWESPPKVKSLHFKINPRLASIAAVIANRISFHTENMTRNVFSRQFGVIHWRRGDQLTTRCKHHSSYLFDFSVNC